jgi:hypothetical protein
MLNLSYGLTAFFGTNLLVYLIKSQASDLSKVAAIILGIIICSNILATIMPGLISELWGFEIPKVTALSIGLWFCLGLGITVGIAS